jgi:hypothetical protein
MVMVVAASPVKVLKPRLKRRLRAQDLRLYRGPTGPKGPAGPQGDTGDTAGWWINEESLGIIDDPSWSF